MQPLHLTILQTSLHWEGPTANLAMLEEKIHDIGQETDLIVLPEMFSTGFSMNTALAEPMNFTTFKWMQQMAAQTRAVVMGSYMVRERAQYFNRLVWMQPDGQFDHYDKRHLFRMGKEHEHYTEGKKILIKTLKGWRICPMICYDLRFPVWSRNVNLAYDLLIYVANWPATRAAHWRTLLQARAIENLSYVVGVNRVGTDAKGLAYSGDSAVINYKGEVLFEEKNTEIIHSHTLGIEELQQYRSIFPAHLDADTFELSRV